MTTRLSATRGTVDPMLILFTPSTGCTLTVLDSNVVAIVLPRSRAISVQTLLT